MITAEDVSVLRLQDGDILHVKQRVDIANAEDMRNLLRYCHPGLRIGVVFNIELEKISEAEMNAAGWYRKPAA